MAWTRRPATSGPPCSPGRPGLAHSGFLNSWRTRIPERTCLVNRQTPEPTVLAQRGLRRPEARAGSPARLAARPRTSAALLPALGPPAGLRRGAETNLTDPPANQKRGRQAEPMGERAEGRPSASSRPRLRARNVSSPPLRVRLSAELAAAGAASATGRLGGVGAAAAERGPHPAVAPSSPRTSLRRAGHRRGSTAAAHGRSILS